MLIRRRPLLYVVGLLIPSIFLMLVDVSSFYLPLTSRTRVVFKVSVLLGYTVFRVNITQELPSTALRTALIGAAAGQGGLFRSLRFHGFLPLLPAGVFFVACMALLMLSLTKSILVVKLLHHSEQKVKQMSLSACLLHRYGAGGGPEVLTSIGTLDSVDPSEGERLRLSKTS